MVKGIYFLLLLTIFSNIKAEVDLMSQAKCYWFNNWAVFSLSQLSNDKDYVLNNTKNANQTITYNFCKNVEKPCNATLKSQMVYQNGNATGSCNRLEGDADQPNSWKLLNSSNNSQGLIITFDSGDLCDAKTKENYVVNMTIKCDDKQDGIKITNGDNFFVNNCTKNIQAISKEACPKLNLFAVSEFFEKYQYYIGFIIILIGILLALFGSKFVAVTIFLGCVLAVILVGFFIVFSLGKVQNTWAPWVVIGVGAALGILLGWFMVKFERIFFTIFGGFMGYVLANFLYNLFVHNISGNQTVIYWVTVSIGIVVLALIGFFFYNGIIIFSTAFVGSYAIIRGISLYAGGFPSEGLVLELIQHGETQQIKALFTWRVYVYLVSILILFGLSVFIQYKYLKREQAENKEQEHLVEMKQDKV